MAGDFPCFDATTATRLRRLQAKDVQRLLRGFEGPQLKQGGLERVVEAFYIAKMKYEHEARLSTPGQQVGKRAGLGYGGLENRPLVKNLDLDLFREKLLDKLGADWGRPTPELLQAQTTAEEAQSTRPDKRRAPSRPECSSPSRLPSVRGLTRSESPLRRGSLSRPRHGGTSVWTTSHPSRTPTLRPRRSSRWVGIPFRRPSWQIWCGAPRCRGP